MEWPNFSNTFNGDVPKTSVSSLGVSLLETGSFPVGNWQFPVRKLQETPKHALGQVRAFPPFTPLFPSAPHFYSFRHALPLVVSGNGDDDVETVEDGLEGDALMNVKHGADGIDDHPEEPLLQILTRQCPQADEGQGVGERVEDGHGAVGPRH